MRELPLGIIQEIELKLNSNSQIVLEMLDEYLEANSFLNSDRIIRCIIFLSKNSIDSFTSYLEAAKGDPRDVMLWAEYTPKNDGTDQRLYDFSNSKI